MSTSDGMVQYHFRDAIGGFFEFPTENARAILPPELQPIEPHHGSSVLSVMAFDFHDSPVGDYGELILSILVSPRVEHGVPMPRSAFFPFRLATTTRESREHAIERWHLPHYMQDISLTWERGGITIHSQAMTGLVEDWDVDFTPFRELWMKNGLQTFHPLQTLASYARR